jgi:outer membrane protein OmpA-like peptidoglycan-associated protein
MTRVGRTWLAIGAIGAIGAGCGGARQDRVGTTTTTGGEVEYEPGSVELYVGRRALGTSDCTRDLTPNVDFGSGTDAVLATELVELDKWAVCLNRSELAHTSIVIVGGDAPGEEGLFVRRALRLRDLLAERGVASSRVVIGAPNATRAGGNGTSGVRIELTHTSMVRALDPPDPSVRYGLP